MPHSYLKATMIEESTPNIVPETVYFDAELRPHRSLSPAGFMIVMVVATAFGFTIGVSFMLAGAWPVVGFCGLEVLLLYVAFRLNFRSGQIFERIRLTDHSLQIRRFGPKGELEQWEIEPSWLRVEIEKSRRHTGQLTLSSHGKSVVVGRFLPPHERLEIATALRIAVERYRGGAIAL